MTVPAVCRASVAHPFSSTGFLHVLQLQVAALRARSALTSLSSHLPYRELLLRMKLEGLCIPFPTVCKFKAHKRCAVRATSNCKWTTLASIGKDIIEDEDGVCPGGFCL